jgi:hypothetical protein
LRQRHGFPLIRRQQASAQRSTSVLFSFVLSLLIVAGSFVIRQSRTFWRDPEKRKAVIVRADEKLTAFRELESMIRGRT